MPNNTKPTIDKRAPLGIGRGAPRTVIPTQYLFDTQYDQGYRPEMNQMWNRADNQAWTEQIWNGLVSRTASIPLKLFGGASNVLGLFTAGYGSGEFQKIWDNPINDAMDSVDESIKEAFPVFYSRDYDQAKGLFGRMATTSFWANDGFDGLAYLASAYIPSTIVGKAVGAVGKSLKLSKQTKGLVEGLQAMGLNSNKASILGTTVYNTISEAGAEAYQTQKEIELLLSQKGNYGEDDIKRIAGESAAGTFLWNSAILAVPNFVQSSFFHKPWTDRVKEMRTAIWNNEGKAASEFMNPMKSILGDAGKGFVSEGLWEENVQSAIQRYEKAVALGETDKDAISEIANGMLVNLKGFAKSFIPGTDPLNPEELEGATSIALGGLIGLGSGAVSGFKEAKKYNTTIGKEESRYSKLFDEYGAAAESLFVDNVASIYYKDGTTKVKVPKEDGTETEIEVPVYATETDKDGNVTLKKDINGIVKGVFNQLRNKQLYDHGAAAALAGDKLYDEYNRQVALATYAHSLLQKKKEDYTLDEILQFADKLDTVAGEEAKALGVENYLKDNIDTLKSYIRDFHAIQEDSTSPTDLKTEDDIANYNFRNFYNKTRFYLQAKERALRNMYADPNVSEKAKEEISNILDDIEQVKTELKDNKAEVKKEFLNTRQLQATRRGEYKTLTEKQSLTNEETERKKELEYQLLEDLVINGNTTAITYNYDLDSTQLQKTSTGIRHKQAFIIGQHIAAIEDAKAGIEAGDDPAYIAQSLSNKVTYLDSSSEEVIQTLVPTLTEELESLDAIYTDLQNKVKAATDISTSTMYDAMAVEQLKDDLVFNGVLEDGSDLSEEAFNDPAVKAVAAEIGKSYAEKLEEVANRYTTVDSALNNLLNAVNKSQGSEERAKKLAESDTATQEVIFTEEAFDHLAYKEYLSFVDKFEAAEKAAENRRKNGDENAQNEFSDKEGLDSVYSKLKLAQAGFKNRDGFAKIKSKIEDALSFIEKTIRPVVLANAELRKAKQIEVNNTVVEDILNYIKSILNTNSELSAAIKKALNGSYDEVVKLIKGKDGLYSYDGVINLLFNVRDKLSEQENKDLLKVIEKSKLEELQKIQSVFNGLTTDARLKISDKAVSSKDSYFYRNTKAAFMQYLKRMFVQEIEDPTTPLYRYLLDNDIQALYRNVQADATLQENKREALLKLIKSQNIVYSLNSIENTLVTKLDAKLLLDTKNKLSTEFKPTPQQNISITETLIDLGIDKGVNNIKFNNWNLITGIAGSGKSFVVGKVLTEFISKLYPNKKIKAFSAKEFTSKNINKAIFGEQANTYTFDNFLKEAASLDSDTVLIIDEIYTFSNAALDTITKALLKKNIKVIALGDPSQYSPETSGSTINSGKAGNLNSILPLTATYRTNIPAISALTSAYQMNHLPVKEVFTENSKSIDDSISNLSETFGVHTGDRETLHRMLSVPTSRTRVLIVTDAQEVAEFKQDYPNLEILTFEDAQGYQWDEVFVSLNQGKLGDKVIEKNRAIYTALSRAKEYIFAEGLPIESATNTGMATAIERDQDEIAENVENYKKNVDTGLKIHELLKGKSAPMETTPVEEQKVPVQEEEGFEGEEPESGGIPRVSIDSRGVSIPEVPVFEQLNLEDSEYLIAHPTNFNLSVLSNPIASGDTFHVIRADKNGTDTYVLLAERGEGRYVTIGLLGDKDFSDSSFGKVFKDIEGRKPGKKVRFAEIATKGEFPLRGVEAVSLAKGTVGKVRPLSNVTGPKVRGNNMIEDAVIKFYNSFFGTDEYGRRIYPADVYTGELLSNGAPKLDLSKDWIIDGKVNWSVVNKHLKVKIFTRKSRLEGDSTPSLAGAPYLVFTNPSQLGKTKSNTESKDIYVPLYNGGLPASSHIVDTIADFSNNVGIVETLTGFKLGNVEFKDLIHAATEGFKIENEQIVRDTNVSLDDILPIKNLDEEAKAGLVNAITNIIKGVYGIKNKPVIFKTKEQAEEYIDGRPDKEVLSITENSGANTTYQVMFKDSTDSEVPLMVKGLSEGKGKVQIALNSLAMANSVITLPDGTTRNIRLNTYSNSKIIRRSKSVLSDRYYTDWHAFYEDYGTTYPISSSEPLAAGVFKTEAQLKNFLSAAHKLTTEEIETLLDSYRTRPYTSETLNTITNPNSFDEFGNHKTLFNPLKITNQGNGVNELGADLASEDNRNALGSMLYSQYSGTAQTRVTINLDEVVTEEELFADEPFKDTNAKTLLDQIVTDDKELQSLIDLISPFVETIPVKFKSRDSINKEEPKANIKKYYASYNSTDKVVYSNYDLGETPKTLVHELLHAVSVQALDNTYSGTGTEEERKFTQRMEYLFDKLNEYAKKNDLIISDLYGNSPSGVTVYEFVANLASPEFRKVLSSIEVRKKSLLKLALEYILDLMGVSKTSAKKAALKTLEELLYPTEVNKKPNVEQSLDDQIDFNLDEHYSLISAPSAFVNSTPGQLISDTGLEYYLPYLVRDLHGEDPVLNMSRNLLRSILQTEALDPDLSILSNLLIASDIEAIIDLLYSTVFTKIDKDTIKLNLLYGKKGSVLKELATTDNEYRAAIIIAVQTLKDNFEIFKNILLDSETKSVMLYNLAKNEILNALVDNEETTTGYRKTKIEVIDSLYKDAKKSTPDSKVGIAKNRLKLLASKLESLDPDSAEYKRILSVELPKAREKYLALKALTSRNKTSGKILLFDILDDIYPKNKLSSVEDVTLYLDDRTPTPKTEESTGISEHIKEYKKSYELSLTESVKDHLSLLKDKSGRLLNPSFVYIKLLQFLVDNTTSSIVSNKNISSLDDLLQRLTENLKTDSAVSTEDRLILESLRDVILLAKTKDTLETRTPLPENIDIQTDMNMAGEVEYYVILNDVRSKPFKTSTEILDYLKSKNSRLDVEVFNTLMDRDKARNLIRELHTSMMSMKETDLMVGTRTNRKGYSVAYIRNKAVGVSLGIKSQIKDRLKDLHNEGKAINISAAFAADFSKSLSILTKSTGSPTNLEKSRAVKDFYSFIGLSELAENLTLSEDLLNDIIESINFFITETKNVGNLKPSDTLAEENDEINLEDTKGTIEYFMKHMDGSITKLAEYISKSTVYLRNPSVQTASGDRFYKIHESSWMYDTLLNFINIHKNKYFKGTRGKDKTRNLPDYLFDSEGNISDFYADNTFVTGISKIDFIAEHEALKNNDTNSVIGFSRENKSYYYHREILQGFLDGIRQYGDSYFLFSTTPSDKPKNPLYKVGLLTQEKVREGVLAAIEHFEKREAIEKTTDVYGKSLNSEFYRNFELLNRAKKEMPKNATKEELADKVISLMEEEASALTEELLKVELRLDINTLKNIHDRLGSAASKVFNNLPSGEISNSVKGEYNTNGLRSILLPLVDAYFKNHYINTFNLHQLFMGDYAAYKDNSWNIIKRFAGAVAPGIRGLVDSEIGMRENYNLLIIDDTTVDTKTTTSDNLKQLIYGTLELTEEQQTEFDDFISQFPKDYDIADAQGFMLPSRKEEIKNSFGRSWGTGNVMKPVHYEIQSKEIPTTGEETYTTAIPVYTKYSSVVLTDELVRKFPRLAALRTKMELANVDEAVFASGIKTGKPSSLKKLDEILKIEDITELQQSTLTLSNRQFRLQHNPAASPSKEVSIFTQLMYFLSVYDSTKQSADEAYAAVAQLIDNGSKDFFENINNKGLRKFLMSKFTGPGSERALQLLSEGVSVDNPLIEKKAIIALASELEKQTVKVKFNGGKLVLQTALGVEKYYDVPVEDKDLKYRREMVNGESIMVAEVIVPESLLTAEQIGALESNIPLYMLGDGMGFRIPSTELHSAVALRVVGTYANPYDNIIIAPKELVPIHGSDFDVDSLFIIMPDRPDIKMSHSPEDLKVIISTVSTLYKGIDDILEQLSLEEAKLLLEFKNTLQVRYEELKDNNFEPNEVVEELNDLLDDFVEAYPNIVKARVEIRNLLADIREAKKQLTDPQKKYDQQVPVGYVKNDGQYEFDKDALSTYQQLVADFENLKPIIEANDNLHFLRNTLNKEIKEAKKLLDKYLKNSILNTMLETITSPDNVLRMLSPISFKVLEDIIEKLPSELKPPTNIDLSNPKDKFKSYLSLVDGKILTGAFADAVKVFAYMSRSGVDAEYQEAYLLNLELIANYNSLIKSGTLPEDELATVKNNLKEAKLNLKLIQSQLKFSDKNKAILNPKNTFKLEIDKKEYLFNQLREKDVNGNYGVTTVFDALLNAAIDNLNVHLLPKMNINTNTGPVVIGMTMLGVPLDVVVDFINNPLFRFLASGETNRMSDFIKEISDKVANYKSIPPTLSDKKLKGFLKKAPSEEETIALYDLFLKAHKIGEDVRTTAGFLNIVRDLDVFVEDIENYFNLVKNKIGSVDLETGLMSNVASYSFITPAILINNPHILAAYKTKDRLLQFIYNNFMQHSENVREFISKASLTDLINRDEIENATENSVLARRTFIRSVLTSIVWDSIGDVETVYKDLKNGKQLPLSKAKSYSNQVIEDVKSLKTALSTSEKIKGTPVKKFLDLFNAYYNPNTGSYQLGMSGGVNLNSSDIQELHRGFKMLNIFEKEGDSWKIVRPHAGFSKLQQDLLNYAILNYGLEFSTSNYANLISAQLIKVVDQEVKELLDDYLKDVTPDKLEYFKLTYYINNAHRLPYARYAELTNNGTADSVVRNGVEVVSANTKTINVYWGKPESSKNTRILSNLAYRPFTWEGREYGSVEHAYQSNKSGQFDKATYDKYVAVGGYGTKIRGKSVNKDFDNLQLMKDLVVKSFLDNPGSEAVAKLLQYGSFTHSTNEVIDKAFLEGLTIARSTLGDDESIKVYYDLKWTPEKPSQLKDFIAQQTSNSVYKVYYKVHNTAASGYYQYVGKSNDAVIKLLDGDFSFASKFNPSKFTLIFHSVSKDQNTYYSSQDGSKFLKEGDIISVTGSHDFARLETKKIKLTKPVLKTKKDGFTTYAYTGEPVIDQHFTIIETEDTDFENLIKELGIQKNCE